MASSDGRADAPAAFFRGDHLDLKTQTAQIAAEPVEIARLNPRQKLGDVLIQQELSHPFRADPRGQHDAIGAGLNELAFRGRRFSARYDCQAAIQAAGAERNEDVGRVIRQDGRQGPGPRDPGAAENVLVRGVAM
jgi:hypothetical protein